MILSQVVNLLNFQGSGNEQVAPQGVNVVSLWRGGTHRFPLQKFSVGGCLRLTRFTCRWRKTQIPVSGGVLTLETGLEFVESFLRRSWEAILACFPWARAIVDRQPFSIPASPDNS